MKKTLLIITLFIGLGNVNAQNASNDATWEETTSFILKYSIYLGRTNSSAKYENFHLTDSILHYQREYHDKIYKNWVDLNGLMKPEFGMVNNNIILQFMSNEYTSSSGEWVSLKVHNNEMYPRLEKAFEHLTYLVSKKRVADSKASGDKF